MSLSGKGMLGSLPKITVGAGGGAGKKYLNKPVPALKVILRKIKNTTKYIEYLIIFLVVIETWVRVAMVCLF